MSGLCACLTAEHCRCTNSYWPATPSSSQSYSSPTPQFPPSLGLPLPGYYGGNATPAPVLYQFVAQQPAGNNSPASSGPSTPLMQSFLRQNSTSTIPFPLLDTTNTPTQPPVQGQSKRKRTSALSGNSRAPKRVVPRASTTSNPSVSVVAAEFCGAGPSPRMDIPQNALPSQSTAQGPSASTQRPDAEFASKKRADAANKASDLYFFVRPLTSAAPPATLFLKQEMVMASSPTLNLESVEELERRRHRNNSQALAG
ncbi:hypothetical protein R3P38DRAFT_2796155 [Favolaschia claudopus]|uniref:Uncharacterized protein n=1 Tax=Favolaschia claudopus TaxID=2862362 RepID=A0AAW0A4R5_9AGAR